MVDDKQQVRDVVWERMRQGAFRFPGPVGRIPHFPGAERAAERLAETDEWRAAATIKCNPDSPQLPIRTRALADGKRLYMAVPKLAEPRPFVLIDPRRLEVPPRAAASIKGAMEHGRPVTIGQMSRIDLVVCGTVAVGRSGARVGKGGGYSDLEFALLTEAGLVDEATVIATTVHPLQFLDEPPPETAHDFRVDLIVTPDEVVRPGRSKRPPGIIWTDLAEEKIAAIPVLRALANERRC